MHDTKVMRQLRDLILKERSPQKIQSLCSLLATVIRENDAEIALRMKLVKKKFASLFDTPADGDSGTKSALPDLDLESVRPKTQKGSSAQESNSKRKDRGARPPRATVP